MKHLILIMVALLLGVPSANAEDREPKFNQIKRSDPEMQRAYDLASETISAFIKKVQVGGDATFLAKLKFRVPELSEHMGSDQFLYIWLNGVAYHPEENLLSGVFFELPKSLSKWHRVGERLGFYPEDVFDWMIIENGIAQGGYTIKAMRSRLKTEEEKARYDEYIGIKSYQPVLGR
ncbi:DUF2314 domain-containing protein [Marinobacter sp. CHS3-4]|uniref:DUF2314 domain-containing protein n=1 Tax=Marinobacter sp. CHS3-4 TaxID=3045174 RepID=UPI0024B61041|nr:DUF2314 domain-containing protein [Marinobacter sp. CHS3-4]MDI9246952.1 DUF2314 domain-containing protein [Marinobacter sp. CHS3-4]